MPVQTQAEFELGCRQIRQAELRQGFETGAVDDERLLAVAAPGRSLLEASRQELDHRHAEILIRPSERGSTGYGRSFAALDDGRRREDAVRDIGATVSL